MRRLLLLFFALACATPALAQRPRLLLDSLGLPPFPGATNVGNIRLPLGAILKPEPGQTATGPKLSDLAIQTYRTPLTVGIESIADHYLKYAEEAGWVLLDDMADSPTNRSLVFWSASAPGYLTVEIVSGPENTRQIDLTRLLGEVDPTRPGELLKYTGKNVRPQRVEATFSGRFLNIATNAFERKTLKAVEARSEIGMGADDARWIAPEGETYEARWTVTDLHRRLTRAQAYAGNGALLADETSTAPAGKLELKAKVRGSQSLATRVVVWGHLPPPEDGSAAPAASEPVVLTEWHGLRPPRTALLEVRRAAASTRTENPPVDPPVDLGPSCDGPIQRAVEWTAETTDTFDFPEDLFGTLFPRPAIGVEKGTLDVAFPQGSGRSNIYTLTRTVTITETPVLWGYAFHGAWIPLPSKRENPTAGRHILTRTSAPMLAKSSTGACSDPAKEASVDN